MRRLNPSAPLAMAMTLALCGILAGPARAEGHGHDRGRERDRGRHHDGDDRGRRERGPTYYYGREPEGYYAPPVVVYSPPRPPSGISFFFPFWFR
jgi:hypothetical protein